MAVDVERPSPFPTTPLAVPKEIDHRSQRLHVSRETPKAAAAFHAYCAAAPSDRSLARLAASLGKPSGYTRQLETWSSVHRWQERVRASDDEVAAARRKKRLADLERMDEEHALIGRTQLLRAVTIIGKHVDAGDTSLSAAITLMRTSYELERLARGAATTRIEEQAGTLSLAKEYINIDPDEEGSEP